MAINFPGPYEIRIFYTVDTSPGGPLIHQFRYSVELDGDPDPGDSFNTIQVFVSGGATLGLHTNTLAVVNVMEDLLSAADATIDYAELWKYEAGTFNATYISSYDISLPGQSANATNPALSLIFTFRTTAGGIMKAVLLDVPGDPGAPVPYATLVPVPKAFADYIIDDTLSPFVARDGGRPFVCLRAFSGENEAVFKKRYSR